MYIFLFPQNSWQFYISFLLWCLLLGSSPEKAFADDLGVRFENPAGLSRDRNLNRVVQTGSAKTGSATKSTANNISVITTGSGNTIVLNVDQRNSGAVVSVSALNGSLNFD